MSTASARRQAEGDRADRRRPGGPGPGRARSAGHGGQKALRLPFGPSAPGCCATLAPSGCKAVAVLLLAVVGVALTVVGPRILGAATDLVFAGLIGRELPAGETRSRPPRPPARGPARLADLVAAMDHLVPGPGRRLRGAVGRLSLVVRRSTWLAALAAFLQGYVLNDVVQGTVRRMRADVEDKLNTFR